MPTDDPNAPAQTTDPADDYFKSVANPPPPPKPPSDAPADPADSYFSQVAGARKALLASSMAGAAETKPEHQSKVLALADKLGVTGDVVEKNYDALNQQVQLRDQDYSRLLLRHPEVADWLTVPDNAKIAHDEVPQIQAMSERAKQLAGIPFDPTGILPDGYMFQEDGKIRGPLSPDGHQAVMYDSLEDLRKKFNWDANREWVTSSRFDLEHGQDTNLGSGIRASLASTLSALGTVGGSDVDNRQDVRRDADEQLAAMAAKDPGVAAALTRIAGGLIGDAPLYLLGGEVGGALDVFKALRAVRAATALPAVPTSTYMQAFWKNAANFAPLGARSGINTGHDNGVMYGSVDFLLNTFGPAAAGHLGIAGDMVPRGTETAAASGGWAGLAGRALLHSGSQGSAMAATELGNALHEYATGVDPDALKSENLLPRLAQAGAMGGILPLAFHLPGEVGNLRMRQQIAAHSAMMDADHGATLMESAEAVQAFQRSPARAGELLKSMVEAQGQRLKFYQSEDFEGLAKVAKIAPQDMADQMGVGEEYRKALATGQVMHVPFEKILTYGMNHEDPAVKTALMTAMRSHPNGVNANEAAKFYKETPDELAKQKLELESDVTKAAQEMKESDPIYQDIMGQVEEGGRPPVEAQQDAKLIAARFNTLAARHNATAKERGAKLMDPVEEYQAFKLKVQKGGGNVIDTVDAVLNRIRSGDVPSERQAKGMPLREFLARRGLQDVGGDLKSMGVDESLAPGQKKLIDPEGWGLDIAAERAFDEGYIEDADTNTLLAAIGEETAGRPVYAPGNEHATLAPLRESIMELSEHLKSKGVDFSRSNAEIKAALAGDPAVARFQQPGDKSPRGPIYYHGAKKDFDGVLRKGGVLFLTEDRIIANHYAGSETSVSRADGLVSRTEPTGKVQAFTVDVKKTLDVENGRAIRTFLEKHGHQELAVRLSDGALQSPESAWSWIENPEVRKVLTDDGYDSARILDDQITVEGSGMPYGHESLAVFGEGTIAKSEPTSLNQPGAKGPRGSLEWNAERHFVMTLNGNANFSTVSHEAGHMWLEVLGDYAQRADAAPEIVKDYHDILEFIGYGTHENKLAMLKEMQDINAGAVREGRDLTAKEQKRLDVLATPHEKFADAIVQYLREGKSPSPELKGAFQRFRLWLSELYKQFKELVHLTPEVKSIFDRMHATDEAIAENQKELGTSTIFAKGNPGYSEAEWAHYLDLVRTEHDRLDNNVYSQATAVMRKENTKTYNREYDKQYAAAKAIVDARPENVALRVIHDGIERDGSKVTSPVKLDKHDVELHGPISMLPRGITTDDGTGISMQAMADRDPQGFRSGDELWQALANYRKPKEVIAEMADGLMKAHHPEMTPEAMHDAAMDAVHANNAHADVLNAESAFLALKALKKPMSVAEMKGIAEHQVDNTNMRDVNPQSHLRAEMKFSDLSTEAFLKEPPDYTTAFLMKQRQELSHALYRAAMEAKEVIDDTGALMKKMAKSETRAMLGKAGGYVIVGKAGEVLTTMDAEEAARLAKEYNGTTQNFRDYMDRMSEAWNDKPTRYDMDYGAVHDFYREASSIHFQAKQAFDLMVQGKKEALQEEVNKATEIQKEAAGGRTITVPRDERELSYRAKDWLRWGENGNRSLAGILRALDGEKADGWHYRNIGRPLNEAQDNETARKIENDKEMKSLTKEWGKRGKTDPVFIPAIGETMKIEQRLAVMLNAGTRHNHERMTTGDGWTPEQINSIIATLDEKDVALVRGIWKLLESKWPETVALKTRTDGIPPARKETIPVKTAFGTVEGGYYPILYKRAVGARAFELSLDKPINRLVGAPRQGHTIESVESTGMKLKYSLDALYRHLDESAHYLSHEDARVNINKIINNKQFAQSVIDHFGIRVYERMAERILNVMQGPRGPQNALEDAMRFVRTRTGLATCGYNAMTVLVHGFGIPQSMYRVGMGKWLSAQLEICSSAGSLEGSAKFIDSKSTFMRDSHHNISPEKAEQLRQGLPGGVLNTMQEHALDGLHLALRTINRGTWLAEYRTRLAEDRGTATEAEHDSRAVELANQAVRDTQGGGQSVDKTYFQDANEFSKMFMQYQIFFTRTYQLLRPSIAGFDKSDPKTYLAVMKAFLPLVVLPAIAEGLFREAMKKDPSNDGSAAFWAKQLAKDNLGYLLSTFLGGRQVMGMIEGFGAPSSPSMRAIGSVGVAVGSARKMFADPTASTAGKFARSANAVAGLVLGIPSNQIDHIVRGIIYDAENGTIDPRAPLFGPPR